MPFGSLWLPVIVSAVVVFVASSILHMALKHHKSDYRRFTDEGSVGAALRKEKLEPGLYVIPYCSGMSEMKDPAFLKKYEEGPVAHLTVLKNQLPNMGKYLTVWFLFCLFVSFFTAYIARHTLHFGEDGAMVLRITGAVAFAAYGMTSLQEWIWKGLPLSNTLRFLFDGALYSLLTGLTFMFLWPAA